MALLKGLVDYLAIGLMLTSVYMLMVFLRAMLINPIPDARKLRSWLLWRRL